MTRQRIELPRFEDFSSSSGTFALTIDHRKMNIGDELQELPVVIRVASHGHRAFLPTGRRMTLASFDELCAINANPRSKRRHEEVEYFRGVMERAKGLCEELEAGNAFSLDVLKDRFSGKTGESDTINGIWEAVMCEKLQKGKAKTNDNYRSALRRFTADMGKAVSFARVSNSFVREWRNKMIAGGLSSTTASIYLRILRVVVNVCIDSGLIQGTSKALFKGTEISKSNRRTGEFLDADTMQRLYDFWLAGEASDDEGKELFAPREKRALFRDLGYFLFTYLAGGMNAADMVNLRYNNHYQSSKGTEFLFARRKTAGNSQDGSIVIFPIDLPPVQELLKRLANEPKPDGYVFPIMNGRESDVQEVEKIHKTNANMRKALRKLCPLAGLSDTPTATWARHSFATNLSNAGVPTEYIDTAMGHAGNRVINFYLGRCPHDKMVEYNSNLLPSMAEEGRRKRLAGLGLTDEKIKEILAAIY